MDVGNGLRHFQQKDTGELLLGVIIKILKHIVYHIFYTILYLLIYGNTERFAFAIVATIENVLIQSICSWGHTPII